MGNFKFKTEGRKARQKWVEKERTAISIVRRVLQSWESFNEVYENHARHKRFNNSLRLLPPAEDYVELSILNSKRPERLVVDRVTGDTYITADHYGSFEYVGRIGEK